MVMVASFFDSRCTVAERLGVFNHFYAVFTEFGEITQNKGHYAVQGHSMSPILVPIESSYTTSY